MRRANQVSSVSSRRQRRNGLDDELALLLAARMLIARADDWTAGAYGRAADGTAIAARSSAAVRWNGVGALKAVAPQYMFDGLFIVGAALRAALLRLHRHADGCGCLEVVSVTAGHAGELAVYDAAIAEREMELADRTKHALRANDGEAAG